MVYIGLASISAGERYFSRSGSLGRGTKHIRPSFGPGPTSWIDARLFHQSTANLKGAAEYNGQTIKP